MIDTYTVTGCFYINFVIRTNAIFVNKFVGFLKLYIYMGTSVP